MWLSFRQVSLTNARMADVHRAASAELCDGLTLGADALLAAVHAAVATTAILEVKVVDTMPGIPADAPGPRTC